MKRKNVAKRIGIASLCLATAISAFSGIASFTNDSIAVAEGTTLSVADLVTATGATVKQDLDTASGTNAQGLRISSDVAYEATFNTIFNGNSVFKFRFPETYDSTLGYYGDFKFHIADATDPNNCFDIVYYAHKTNETGVYVQWGTEKRMTNSLVPNGAANYYTSTEKVESDVRFAPAFLSTTYNGSTELGTLSLVWNNSGVLSVQARSLQSSTAAKSSNCYMKSVARFDGTYDSNASKNGYTGRSAMGLPKLSFPNGYTVTVSSDFTVDGVDDHGTDVVFTQIKTAVPLHTSSSSHTPCWFIPAGTGYKNLNGSTTAYNNSTTYTLNSASTTEFTSQFVDAYAALKANMQKGDVLLGWKDAEGALYPSSTVYEATDISGYTPVVLGFDTINGASVRIGVAGGQSGIRFMALFDKAEYRAAKSYIQSFGSLIAYTDDLDQRDFTIANYQSEIDAQSTSIRQVANTKNTFNYDLATGMIGASGQPAYSMAVVDIEDYTQRYSARGYLEVKYADDTTQYIYTDYNEADNSRSVAEVAYKIKMNAAAEYENYEQAQKDVIDNYADAYVAP